MQTCWTFLAMLKCQDTPSPLSMQAHASVRSNPTLDVFYCGEVSLLKIIIVLVPITAIEHSLFGHTPQSISRSCNFGVACFHWFMNAFVAKQWAFSWSCAGEQLRSDSYKNWTIVQTPLKLPLDPLETLFRHILCSEQSQTRHIRQKKQRVLSNSAFPILPHQPAGSDRDPCAARDGCVWGGLNVMRITQHEEKRWKRAKTLKLTQRVIEQDQVHGCVVFVVLFKDFLEQSLGSFKVLHVFV